MDINSEEFNRKYGGINAQQAEKIKIEQVVNKEPPTGKRIELVSRCERLIEWLRLILGHK